jgi:hypothetical protein
MRKKYKIEKDSTIQKIEQGIEDQITEQFGLLKI